MTMHCPENEIKSLIPNRISSQQSQFNNGTGDNNPDNIEVIEYSYNSAEPNCWLVFAKWKLK